MAEEQPNNIVVKMPNWLGDAVMATPILHDLKAFYPKSKLTLLAPSHIVPLFSKDPYLDDILSYEKPNHWIRKTEHLDVIRPLQMGKYDLGILLSRSFASAWWFWRGHVKRRIGFRGNGRSFLLTDPISYPHEGREHQIAIYKQLITPLGIPISNSLPHLFLGPSDESYAAEFKTLYQIPALSEIIGVNPGAAYGSAKCWLPERFREVIVKLIKDPNRIVLCFGDRAGASLVSEICQGLTKQVINLAGKTTLRELMALIGKCKALLTNDSGPMHIASALHVPLVALFGSTDYVKTGPYHGETVIYKNVECAPCFKRVCPIDFRCMARISSEEVYQAVVKAIR
jgi:heptosyltransferase-2